ncbi:MAG: hypothetical protein U9N59_05690 [Campylobacterota bacterium]|nr:hypothetical protein [Campylobacterota bacterium]
MNKSLLSLAVVSALSLGFTGCGSSSDDTPASSGDTDTSTDVEVERGKVYDATVTDSSSPALTATKTTGSNVYTFASTPTYPIKVNGGWIDVDGDGEMTTEDIALDIEMTSYSNVVTPITTYISDANETIREQRMSQLMSDMNITSQTELLKPPSKAQNNTIFLANAIFKAMKENNTTDLSNNFTDINSSFSTLKTTFTQSGSQATQTSAGIAKWIEEKTVTALVNDEKLSKFTQDYITANTPSSDDTAGSSDDTSSSSNDDNSSSENNSTTAYQSETITHNGLTYKTVKSPTTNKVWLDRNIGATDDCNTTSQCHGDYYQWGRNTDGHEDGSITTHIQATDLNNMDNKEITSGSAFSEDWAKNIDANGSLRKTQWAKVDGTSVCPTGFRVPEQSEFLAETSGVITNKASAAGSFLMMPTSGIPEAGSSVGSYMGYFGAYWTNTITDDTRNSTTSYNSSSGSWESINIEDSMSIQMAWSSSGDLSFAESYRTSRYQIRCIKAD